MTKNRYEKHRDEDAAVDMYRSNDVVQFERSSIFVRPFVKVGEKADQVKVFQYFLEDGLTRHSESAPSVQ